MSIATEEPRVKQAETALPTPRREQAWLNEQTRTVCLVVLAVVASGVALAYLKGILTPLLVALFLFYLILPLTDALRRLSVPRWLAPAFFVMLLLLLVLLGQVIYGYAEAIRGKTDEYRKKVMQRTTQVMRGIGMKAVAEDDSRMDQVYQKAWNDLVQYLAQGAVGAVEMSLMVVFYLLYLFIEAKSLPRRVQEAFDPETAEDTHRLGRDINRKIKRYLMYKTYINFGLGASTGLICWVLGLDFWPLWAVLMFFLNYVTYIGSIVALAPPVALALLQFENPLVGIALALVLIANRVLWIDYIEIRALGNLLNLSPVVLLLAIAFFGYIWGPVGLLLAVPLMTTTKIILSDFEQTRHLAVLISEEGDGG